MEKTIEITKPYDTKLNVFNDELKEVFEIIKEGTTRQLKQLLGLNTRLSLESHYYQKYTPLMEAVYLQNRSMTEFICKAVKEKYTQNNVVSYKYTQYLNQINIEGKSALIIAVLSNDKVDILKYLISEGANFTIEDRHNKTIFDYALFAQSDEIEDYVLQLK